MNEYLTRDTSRLIIFIFFETKLIRGPFRLKLTIETSYFFINSFAKLIYIFSAPPEVNDGIKKKFFYSLNIFNLIASKASAAATLICAPLNSDNILIYLDDLGWGNLLISSLYNLKILIFLSISFDMFE